MDENFRTVEIEINHGCNKACSYCPISIAERIEKGHMSIDVYQTIISQLKKINYSKTISYSFFNEPTLSPNLEPFIKIAKSNLPGVTIHINSNGTVLTTSKYRSLVHAGVDKFVITKHENIDNYVFDKTIRELSPKELEILEFRNYSELKLTNRGGVLKHIKHDIDTTFLPCFIPNKVLTITLEGNVTPCFEDFYQKNQMGNIMDSDLLDIWNSEKYKKFRESLNKGLRHKFEACNKCNRTEVL